MDQASTIPNKRKLRWDQFSLRTLLIVVTVFGCGLGWLGLKVQTVRRQAAAVDTLRNMKAQVLYDYQFKPRVGLKNPDCAASICFNIDGRPSGPDWLRSLLGVNLFNKVRVVSLFRARDKARTVACLRELPDLEYLYLDGEKFTDADFACLQGMTQLKSLYLCYSQATGPGLQYLAGMSQLDALDLEGVPLTDAAIDYLTGLKNLTELNISESLISDAGFQRLETALPNCMILR